MVNTKKVEIKYGQKKKGVSVGLAVFLSQWTWLYTYREDAWKFWVGLMLNLILWWTLIVPLGVWIWAMVDTGTKLKEWYENY